MSPVLELLEVSISAIQARYENDSILIDEDVDAQVAHFEDALPQE